MIYECHLTHFSKGLGVLLSVTMNMHSRYAHYFLEAFIAGRARIAIASQTVYHSTWNQYFRTAQRKADNGTQVLFILRGGIGFDRLMTTVMRARRNFIHQHITIFGYEHFHGK